MLRPARIGIWMPTERLERLRVITEKFDISRSRLISAICAVMTDRELTDVIARFHKLEEIEVELRETADQNMLDYIRGKSPEDLERMLAAAKAAVPS